ncbi:MAG: HK97-gp10 family putative phage morphogenesis protein [Pseudomonadota bacterium]|nr:HK97-gp10 family putative phage morphogenesis protein [Pseudomonadota bacterium]
MDVNLEFDGARELRDALLGLNAKTQKVYAREAGKAAMSIVQRDMAEAAPYKLGILKAHIKIRTTAARHKAKKRKHTGMQIRVGVFTRKGTVARTRNQAALSAEFGNSRQQAKPFIRPALRRNAQTVLNTFRKELGTRLENHNVNKRSR